MKVRAGRLTEADRALIAESNQSGRSVLVATEASTYGAGQMVGVVTTWDYESFTIGGWSFSTRIPWESAVAVWWRDEAPPEEEVDALLAGRAG